MCNLWYVVFFIPKRAIPCEDERQLESQNNESDEVEEKTGSDGL